MDINIKDDKARQGGKTRLWRVEVEERYRKVYLLDFPMEAGAGEVYAEAERMCNEGLIDVAADKGAEFARYVEV